MFKLSERGVIHLLLPIILLLGIIGTVYLITAGPLKLFPKAASEPISVPITPVPTPSPTGFTNLSATLTTVSATYNFAYSAPKDHFEVDMSSSSNFGYDIYYKFGNGTASPVVVNDVTKMGNYKCGTTMYWRVRAVYNGTDAATSAIQKASFACPTPSPTPALTFSNLSATLAVNKATFNFKYSNSKETLYKVHLSTSSNFTTGVYYNFVTGSNSPLIETNVKKMSQYKCGVLLYWKVEAVYTGGNLSPLKSSRVSC